MRELLSCAVQTVLDKQVKGGVARTSWKCLSQCQKASSPKTTPIRLGHERAQQGQNIAQIYIQFVFVNSKNLDSQTSLAGRDCSHWGMYGGWRSLVWLHTAENMGYKWKIREICPKHSYVPINKVSKFQRPVLEKEPCEKSDCKLVRFECVRSLRSNPEIQVLIQNKKTQCDFKRKSSAVDSVHCFQVFLFRILLKLTNPRSGSCRHF